MPNRRLLLLLALAGVSLAVITGGCGPRNQVSPEQTRLRSTSPKAANRVAPVKFDSAQARAIAGLVDLLGLQPNRRWIFTSDTDKGQSYETDLTFSSNNRYQLEDYRGTTVTARVIEIRKDGAYEVLVKPKHKSRTNLLSSAELTGRDKAKDRKLVAWPVRKGERWTQPDGVVARIIATSSTRTVPMGKQRKVVEIRTEPGGPVPMSSTQSTVTASNTKAAATTAPQTATRTTTYYSPGLGLVETEYMLGNKAITAKLNRITTVLQGSRTNRTAPPAQKPAQSVAPGQPTQKAAP